MSAVNDTRRMIACCGLDCAQCVNHKGEIADMARDLRKVLRRERFALMAPGLAKYFKDLADYERCYAVLGAMVRLRCGRGCREGGGNPGCKVRVCCRKNSRTGCWECSDFETCGKLDFLKPIHGDEHLKNLREVSRES